MCGKLIQLSLASYGVSVRRAGGLPPASFRFRLAADTLALSYGYCCLHHQGLSPLRQRSCRAHHIATDGNFVASIVVTAANKADAEPLPEVLKQCEANAMKPEQVVGDSAYCIWPTKESMALDGIELIAKVPSEARVDGRYPKSMFDIDTLAGVVRCPEGSKARFDPAVIESRKGAVVCFSDCAACPSRTECTRAKVGRTISVHPYEPEMAAERKKQDTAEFKEFYAQRSDGERVKGHMTRHGARNARHIGIFKVWCQEILEALNFNIKAFARLSAATTG